MCQSATHAHSHAHHTGEYHQAFAVGIALNSIFVVLEIYFGLQAKSLALLADAIHNLGDVLSLLVAWLGYYFALRQPTDTHTYGMGRLSIYATLFNAVSLVVTSVWIIYEALLRLQNPVMPHTGIVAIVATIGIFINLVTALYLMRGQKDVNIKGAMVHMFADAGISAGVVVAALVIGFTGFVWIDPAISLVISALILYSSLPLFREAVALTMDAVPQKINHEEIKKFFQEHPDIENIFDLRIWGVSTTKTALTVHVTIAPDKQHEAILRDIRQKLKEKFDLAYITIQLETDHTDCVEK